MMEKIRGLIIHSRINYLDNYLDNQQRKKFLESLDENTRLLLSDLVFPVNLYRFKHIQNIDAALSSFNGQRSIDIAEKIGHDFAMVMLDRYFFNYINDQNPSGFLEQSQRLYSSLWHFGTLDYTAEEGGGMLTLSHPLSVHPFYTDFLKHYFGKGLEVCGAENVQLESKENEKKTQITWKIQWD